nr:hypothetical protein [Tanacetum cinerariifolium]
VMATSVISVSSEDSMGTPAGRVILFGTIPTTIPDTTPLIAPPTTDAPSIAPTIPPSPDYTPPIPHGRPYRYHLNGPVHMMTVRKRVRPLPVQQLSVRHPVDHSSSDSS